MRLREPKWSVERHHKESYEQHGEDEAVQEALVEEGYKFFHHICRIISSNKDRYELPLVYRTIVNQL